MASSRAKFVVIQDGNAGADEGLCRYMHDICIAKFKRESSSALP